MKLFEQKDIHPKSIIAVTKPYMERRLYATYMKQWPDVENVDIVVTSPKLAYEEHTNDMISQDTFINVMVGNLQRIKEFPMRGFQIEQEIPDDIWAAYERLVAAGYTKHQIDF